MDMDISMDIHAKSVDMDMDMDGKFHIHGNPEYILNRKTIQEVFYLVYLVQATVGDMLATDGFLCMFVALTLCFKLKRF